MVLLLALLLLLCFPNQVVSATVKVAPAAKAEALTNDDDAAASVSGEREDRLQPGDTSSSSSSFVARQEVSDSEALVPGGGEKGRLAAAHAAADEDGKVGQSLSSSLVNDNDQASSSTHNDPALTSDSVVLITGAAGFIGSELALALLRTYNVRKLLLVDDLGIDSENESAYVPPPPPAAGGQEGKSQGGEDSTKKVIYEILREDRLGQFEMKRQRAFRIFYELTSAHRKHNQDEVAGNINNAEATRFYRADMRPSIPEFFDFGEVPLLEGIFQSHPDITHVVHLADVPLNAQNQAIPRNKDSVKTGRMEGLLEEMRLMIERAAANNSNGGGENVFRGAAKLPQFVYASSHEVYDRITPSYTNPAKEKRRQEPQQPNPPPFREDLPITTPSSLHGTAKLIDEVLASAYHSTHGIYSVGLRFFNVYGPWNAPGTQVFDLAEHILALNNPNSGDDDVGEVGGSSDSHHENDINDYVFIDDAVDAILGAMQYRPPGNNPPPVVFNVGTGKGYSLQQLKDELSRHFPKALGSGRTSPERRPTKSIASTHLSGMLLGFAPQFSLEEGLAHTLTWHRDRTFPYGHNPTVEESFEVRGIDNKISKSLATSRRRALSAATNSEEEGGGGECSPLDRECLRDALAFPCASECRRLDRCTPSAWDDISQLSKVVTSGCDVVLYTVLLDDTAEQIPSAISATTTDYLPFVGAGLPEDVGKRTQARCNVAFMSDRSPLVKRLRSEGEEYLDEEVDDAGGGNNGGTLPPLLRHGFWTVLPVPSSSDANSSWLHAFDGTFTLEYLPKVSPGRFFGSSVRFAVYAAPTVLVKNLPTVLKRMESGPIPPTTSEDGPTIPFSGSSTALMLASKRPACDPAQRGAPCIDTYTRPPTNDVIQSHAYNMIRMALRGDVLGGGLESTVDSSLIVHSLREEESRLFRCDMYGEVAQWGASSDERAVEFIISLHDLWSRAFVYWTTGSKPWWIDAGRIKEHGKGGQQQQRRRFLNVDNSDSIAEQEEKWMGILSQSDALLFTHIVSSEDLGVVHLE